MSLASIDRFRFSACCIGLIIAGGCAAPQSAYRKIYGPGPWDWDIGGTYFERPYLEGGNAAGTERAVPESGRIRVVPRENLGRPEPPPSKIPGISDIPEIPDEPTVLPE